MRIAKMRRFLQNATVLLAALATFAAARPSSPGYTLHEKRDTPLRAWAKRDSVAPNALLPMKIGLKQQNLHRGYDYLMDVYVECFIRVMAVPISLIVS